MKRTSAWTLTILLGLPALASCGGDRREAPEPPPIAAAKPDETKTAPAPVTESAPPPAAAPAPVTAAEPKPAATAKPGPAPVAPAFTPGTSLPGSIPPAPLPDPDAKPATQQADSLQWLRDSEARKADYARRVDEAKIKLAAADADAAQWEKTLLAFKNPFLPRPQLSPADAQAIRGMGGAARAEWAQGRLAESRAARDAAQKALDTLEANPPLN